MKPELLKILRLIAVERQIALDASLPGVTANNVHRLPPPFPVIVTLWNCAAGTLMIPDGTSFMVECFTRAYETHPVTDGEAPERYVAHIRDYRSTQYSTRRSHWHYWSVCPEAYEVVSEVPERYQKEL